MTRIRRHLIFCRLRCLRLLHVYIVDVRVTSENIRNYCEEALNITQRQGVQDGLAFLIGEKFSLVYYQLKTAYNKLKYLYPDAAPRGQANRISKGNKSLQLSYIITVNENYREILERVDHLEKVIDKFIGEIKVSFSLENIRVYLNSYPRLALKGDSSKSDMDCAKEGSQMTVGDIFSEVEDILIIDELKNLFIGRHNERSQR